MTEKDFLDKIDCNFPYNNINKWIELVKVALSIWDNCVFWIIHELVRPPKSVKINKKKSLKILEYIDNNFSHDLKKDFILLSIQIINNNTIDEWFILNLMNKVKKYNCLSIPLNVLYFSIVDSKWNIENKYNEIIDYWRWL